MDPANGTSPLPGSSAPSGRRPLAAVGLALLVLASAILRLHGLGRGLWTAEAWVANSALADRWADVFHYGAWLQTTPPLFLVLVRATARVLGPSNVSLRLVPWALGVLSVALVAVVARNAFRAPFAFLCAGLVAFSPAAVAYSKELKQFTGDAASTALVLLALWTYARRRDAGRFALAVAAVALALLLSYTAVMLVPTAAYLIASADPTPGGGGGGDRRSRPRVRAGRVAVLVLVAGAVWTAEYVLLVRPNQGPVLSEYWKPGFPHWHGLGGVVAFYGRYFLAAGPELLVNFVPSRATLAAAAAAGGAVLAGAILVGVRRPERRPLVVLAVGPGLTLAGVNLLRLYPVSSERLVLFLVPCAAVGFVLVVQEWWEARVARGTPAAPWIWLVAPVGLLSAATVLTSDLAQSWSPWHEEDVEGAVRYLEAHVAPGDLVYVHASVIEPAKLYARMLGWTAPPILYGSAGFPCCTRDPEDGTRRNGSAAAEEEMEKLSRTRIPGALWLLFTARDEHWEYLQRDDEELFAARLQARGWRSRATVPFSQVVVHEMVSPGQACAAAGAPAR